MGRIYTSMEQLIGNTPMLELTKFAKETGCCAKLLAKLEMYNPGGSVKDRVARSMLDAATLAPGAVIIEPTSGNTGIGLAALAAARGYRAIIVMPDTMSVERQRLMAAYGAEVLLSPGAKGMAGAIAMAEALAATIPGSMIAGQFTNPANPAAHRQTGEEIWEACDGSIDIFVTGAGTGGTLTGVGRYLKEKNPAIQIVAVEPAASAVLSGQQAGSHGLQGIGAGFVPQVLDTGLIDRIIPVREEDAFHAMRLLARKEGILAGISSGAALHAAQLLATMPEHTGKTIVTLLPDSGERYLSMGIF